jgi:hypothetical protein
MVEAVEQKAQKRFNRNFVFGEQVEAPETFKPKVKMFEMVWSDAPVFTLNNASSAPTKPTTSGKSINNPKKVGIIELLEDIAQVAAVVKKNDKSPADAKSQLAKIKDMIDEALDLDADPEAESEPETEVELEETQKGYKRKRDSD